MSVKIHQNTSRACRLLFNVAALILLGAHNLQAQIVIKQKPVITRATPSSTAVKPALGGPLLKWNNGESIDGELAGATDREIIWKAAAFSDPLILRIPYLHSMEFPQQEKEPVEPFLVTMRNGDRLYGKLTALDEKSVTLSSDCHGECILLHSEVVSLRRLRGKELIYSGPVPGAPWRAINDRYNSAMKKRSVWNSGEGGLPVLGSWNGINFLPLALPERVEVAFHVRSTALPQFRVYLNANYGQGPSVETWDDRLVLVHDGHFAILRKMDAGEREVNLRICWNQKEKRCAVFTMQGEKIAELVTKDEIAPDKSAKFPTDSEDPFALRNGQTRSANKPETGFCIHNIGLNLTLESLRVKEWNGEAPPKLKLDQPRIELAAGGVVIGKAVQADSENVTVQDADGSRKTLPLQNVEAVVLASAPMSATRTNTELQFADGTFLTGRLLEIKNDTVSLQSSGSTNPIQSKITTLKQVRLRVPKSTADPAEPSLAELDQLDMGKSSLHGTPVGSGDVVLRWLPVGGQKAIPLASGSDAVMIRSIKADSPAIRASSLFFLTNGDILPGELKGMDESFVELHSYLSNIPRFAAASFHAIQFSGPDFNPQGFQDPGWRMMKGAAENVSRKDNEVTITNGGVFGHPSVLQADELKFNMRAKDGYGALRMKFFVNDIKSAAKSISMLLMHSGNEIYCGQDNGDGQFQERAQLSVVYNKPVQIKLVLNDNNIEIFVNDMLLHKLAALPSKREGMGLVIEPADVWGNGEREIILSNFSAHVNLERGWFPAIDSEARAKALMIPRFRRDDQPTHILVAANGDLLRGHIEAVSTNHIRVRSGLETINIPRERVSAAIWLLPPDKNAPKNIEPAKPDEKTAENNPGPQNAPIMIGAGGMVRIQVKGGALINNGVVVRGGVIGNDLDIQLNAEKPLQADLGNSGNANPDQPATKDNIGSDIPSGGSPGFTPTHWLQLRDGGRIALAVDRFDADHLIGHSPVLGICEIPLDRIHVLRFKNPGPTPSMLAYKDWRLQLAPEPVLPETGGQSSPLLGQEAKDFRLPLLGGGEFVLANEKGKVIVLDFWATWCGPCVQSLPGLIDAMKPFDSKKVKFIGVNQGEEAAQVKRFIEQRGWKFAVALDATQSVAQQFGVTGIPHTVIIGPDGKVAWVNTGYRPGADKDAAAAVSKLLESAVPK